MSAVQPRPRRQAPDGDPPSRHRAAVRVKPARHRVDQPWLSCGSRCHQAPPGLIRLVPRLSDISTSDERVCSSIGCKRSRVPPQNGISLASSVRSTTACDQMNGPATLRESQATLSHQDAPPAHILPHGVQVVDLASSQVSGQDALVESQHRAWWYNLSPRRPLGCRMGHGAVRRSTGFSFGYTC